MKLITKELEKRFAAIGSQNNELDPKVIAKFFLPWGATTWLATEYNAEDNICFGYVKGLVAGEWNDEWGTFSIDDLESVKGPLGLGIERDIHFAERPFSQAVGKEYFERNFKGVSEKLKAIAKEQEKYAEPEKQIGQEDAKVEKRKEEMEQMQDITLDRSDDLGR